MDPDNNSTPLKFPTTLPHFDTEIKHSSQLDPFIVPATSTADTSVDRVKNINAYELRNSVFSTDQFSELYLDPLVTDEKLELVWKTATDAMGPSLLYDTRSRQWSNTATTNRNKPTEEQHVELLRRVQRVIQQQLGSDNVLSAFKNSGNVPLNGGEAIRKPDVFTVHRDATTTINGNNSTKYNWRQVRVIGELKQNQLCVGDEKGTNVSRAEMVITLSRYAREIFIQPGRRYVHGFTLCGNKMRNYLFDRAGALCSFSFDIDIEPKRFLRHIIAYLTMSSESLGFDPHIKVHHPDVSRPIEDHVYDVTLPWIYNAKLQPFVFFQNSAGEDVKMFLDFHNIQLRRSLSSRGTTGWPARIADKMDRGDESNGHSYQWNYFVKIQWRNEERPNEGEILKEGRGLPGLVQHYFHADLGNIHRDIRRNYQIDRLWVVKVKPEGIHGPGGFRKNTSGGSSTTTSALFTGSSNIRTKRVKSTKIPPYNRIQTLLVMEGVGRHLSKATTPRELLTAIRDAIIGHQGLLEKGYLHRDISYGNIVITANGGQLIDVDYANKLADISPSGAPHRTGTPQFMAIAICEQSAKHSFRHDLESFFYVLLWMCTNYGFNPKDLPHEEGLIRIRPSSHSPVQQISEINSNYKMSALLKKDLANDLSDTITNLAFGWNEYERFIAMLIKWVELLFPEVISPVTKMRKREFHGTLECQKEGKLYNGMLEAMGDVLRSM